MRQPRAHSRNGVNPPALRFDDSEVERMHTIERIVLTVSSVPAIVESSLGHHLSEDDIFLQASTIVWPERKPRSTEQQQRTETVFNNIVIQIFLNAKNVSDLSNSKHVVTTIRKQTTIGSEREIGRWPLGSSENPIIMTKNFDKSTLTFIEDEQPKAEHNPKNLVEVKAVISGVGGDTSRMMEDDHIHKQIDEQFRSSIPVIIERLNGMQKRHDTPIAESQTFGESHLQKQIRAAISDEQRSTTVGDLADKLGDEILKAVEDRSVDTTTAATKSKDEVLASDIDKAIEEAVEEVSKELESNTAKTKTETEVQAIVDEIERTLMTETDAGHNRVTMTLRAAESPEVSAPAVTPVEGAFTGSEETSTTISSTTQPETEEEFTGKWTKVITESTTVAGVESISDIPITKGTTESSTIAENSEKTTTEAIVMSAATESTEQQTTAPSTTAVEYTAE
ncbi:unnamed protein product, partial [Toxocara canis]|uniref:Dystroglycan n=1 Tax=Toxocara canis TaxID=6265 RepID=A0A183UUY2_TOXCA